MSWQTFEADKKKQQRARRQALIALLLLMGLILAAIVWLLSFMQWQRAGLLTVYPAMVAVESVNEVSYLVEQTAVLSNPAEVTVVPDVYAQTLSTASKKETTSLQQWLADGTPNLRHLQSKPPSLTLQTAMLAPAPQQIRYTIGETQYQWPLAVARLVDADLEGVAKVWRVPNWRRPAWIPQSTDCGLSTGQTIIAGHVSWLEAKQGPFHDLGGIEEGAEIECMGANGRWVTYRVVERYITRYQDTQTYWGEVTETPQLILYTCTPEITGIIVVRAVLIDEDKR